MKITVKQLLALRACRDQVHLFQKKFGEEVEVTEELVLKHYQEFDLNWLARTMFTGPVLAEYEKIQGPAWAEYLKIQGLAKEEYLKIEGQALEEYKKIGDMALAEYEKNKAIAFFKGWQVMKEGSK